MEIEMDCPLPPSSIAGPTKNLSFWSIVIIAANTMNGPGLTTIPASAQNAGLVTYTVLVALSTFITAYVVRQLSLLIWSGNSWGYKQAVSTLEEAKDDDDEEEEEATNQPNLANNDMVALTTKAFASSPPPKNGARIDKDNSSPSTAKVITSIAMVGCALALALAQMMLCAKIADATIVAALGSNCGVGVLELCHRPLSRLSHPSSITHVTTTDDEDEDDDDDEELFQEWPLTASSPPSSLDNVEVPSDEDKASQRREYENRRNAVHCTQSLSMASFADGEEPVPTALITAGLIGASVTTMALASVDLDSMIYAQYVLFACLLFACGRFWLALSAPHSLEFSGTAAGVWYYVGPRPFDAVGPTLFNFAFVVTAPALSCSSQNSNQAANSLITACVVMGVLYTLLGWVGAPAAAAAAMRLTNNEGGEADAQHVIVDDNLLSLVLLRGTLSSSADHNDATSASFWDVLSVIIFGVSQLAAIPVYCELARDTLSTHVGVFSRRMTFFLCHVAPWLVCVVTYNSRMFELFIEWSSLLLLGFCNFSLPLLLHIMTTTSTTHDADQTNGIHGTVNDDLCLAQVPVLEKKWPDISLVVYSLVTGSIAGVIVQRIAGSFFLAQIVFMATVSLIFLYYRKNKTHLHPY